MPLWPFTPQDALAETLTGDVRQRAVAPMTDVAARVSDDNLLRGFRLRYSVVTSQDAAGMAAFFRDRRGAYESFDFINPNDAHVYLVRFDTALRLELFTPTFFRHGGELVLMTVSSGAVGGVGGGGAYGEGGYGEGGYGG